MQRSDAPERPPVPILRVLLAGQRATLYTRKVGMERYGSYLVKVQGQPDQVFPFNQYREALDAFMTGNYRRG